MQVEHDLLSDYGVVIPEPVPSITTTPTSKQTGFKILKPSFRPPSPTVAWDSHKSSAASRRSSSACSQRNTQSCSGHSDESREKNWRPITTPERFTSSKGIELTKREKIKETMDEIQFSLKRPQCTHCYNSNLAKLRQMQLNLAKCDDEEHVQRLEVASAARREQEIASLNEKQSAVRRDLIDQMSRSRDALDQKSRAAQMERSEYLRRRELEADEWARMKELEYSRRNTERAFYRKELDDQIQYNQKSLQESSRDSMQAAIPRGVPFQDRIREERAQYLGDLLSQILENRKLREEAQLKKQTEEDEHNRFLVESHNEAVRQARLLEQERRRQHQQEMSDFLQLLEKKQKASALKREQEAKERMEAEKQRQLQNELHIQRARERVQAERDSRVADLARYQARKQREHGQDEHTYQMQPIISHTLYECPSCLRAVPPKELSSITADVRRIVTK